MSSVESSFIAATGEDKPSLSIGGDFDRAFRKEIAAWIHGVLSKAYVTDRDAIREEANKRGITVEVLLASYITRVVMHRVDDEYV